MRRVVTTFLVGAGIMFAVFTANASSEGLPEKKSHDVVTKETVWNPDRQAAQAIKQRCADLGGRQLEECFADGMEALGSSPEAAAFTRSFGGGAFVKKLREVGKRDIAYIVYPFRGSETQGVLLVNGEPPFVDVDDIVLLPKEGLEQDKVYGSIKKTYPRVTLWPGDRSPKYPLVEPLPDGGQSFVVPYSLRNLCHACEVLGTAYFAFDFDREGRLMGERFVRVEPVTKKVVTKMESRKDTEQIRFIVMTEENKEFTVRLSSNRTTGFQWRPADPIDERVVRLVRSEYVPFDRAGAVGAGGEEVWTFVGVTKGETEVTMEYVRPWEKGQPALKTATIKVSVRQATQKN